MMMLIYVFKLSAVVKVTIIIIIINAWSSVRPSSFSEKRSGVIMRHDYI